MQTWLHCQTCFISRWYKDGKPLNQGEGLRVAANGQRLLVSRAQVSDTARFQCVAANEAGDNQRDFTVVVHGKTLKFSVISFILTKDFCGYFSSCNVIYAFLKSFSSFQFLHPFAPLDLLNVPLFSTNPSVWNALPMASQPRVWPGLKMAGLSTHHVVTLRCGSWFTNYWFVTSYLESWKDLGTF